VSLAERTFFRILRTITSALQEIRGVAVFSFRPFKGPLRFAGLFFRLSAAGLFFAGTVSSKSSVTQLGVPFFRSNGSFQGPSLCGFPGFFRGLESFFLGLLYGRRFSRRRSLPLRRHAFLKISTQCAAFCLLIIRFCAAFFFFFPPAAP